MGRNIQVQPRNDCTSGCHCEALDCTLLNDPFSRADDTDLGADWSEVSGSWSIASGMLHIASTDSDRVCISTITHSSSAMKVSANVTISTNGNAARLIVAYVDSNNYLFVEATANGASGTLRLYKRVSGSNTQLYSGTTTITAGAQYPMTVCVNGSTLCGTLGGVLVGADIGFSPTGTGFGVGTGTLTSGTIDFDDFLAEKVENGCAECECPPCTCIACEDNDALDEYSVTIASVGGTCSGLNGTYYVPFSACTGSPTGEECDWTLSPAASSVCSANWDITIVADAGNVAPANTLSVTITDGTRTLRWRYQTGGAGTKLDCLSPPSLTLITNTVTGSGSPTCVLAPP